MNASAAARPGAVTSGTEVSAVTTPETTPAAEVAEASPRPWGRVDEHGAVFVRDGDGERQVGEYPEGEPSVALAY